MIYWRRGRDSNPRYAINVHTLSRRAPSTTRTPLRKFFGYAKFGGERVYQNPDRRKCNLLANLGTDAIVLYPFSPSFEYIPLTFPFHRDVRTWRYAANRRKSKLNQPWRKGPTGTICMNYPFSMRLPRSILSTIPSSSCAVAGPHCYERISAGLPMSVVNGFDAENPIGQLASILIRKSWTGVWPITWQSFQTSGAIVSIFFRRTS